MNPASSHPARYAASRAVGAVWWYFLFKGLLLLLAGIFMLFKPDLSLVAFTQLIGLLLIVDGALSLGAVFTGQSQSRFGSVVRGGLMLVAGIFIFAQPALVSSVAIKTVLFIVAPFVILSGVVELVGAFRGREDSSGRKASWLNGLLTTLFGLLLILAPMFFGEMLVRILGMVAILIAIPLLFLALKFRKAGKRLEAGPSSA